MTRVQWREDWMGRLQTEVGSAVLSFVTEAFFVEEVEG